MLLWGFAEQLWAIAYKLQTFQFGGGGESSVAPYTAMMWRAIASDWGEGVEGGCCSENL